MAKESSCKTCDSDACSAKEQRDEESLEEFLERQALAERLCRIRHKLLVLSGKGGVGKSTVAANLAVAFAAAGLRAGLLDIDLHGPSIPKLLHLEGRTLDLAQNAMEPVAVGDRLKVVSIGFLLQRPDDAVIWRGPLKMGVIKQFLRDVEWGELDCLVVDSPLGTGDEPLSICQLMPEADGALVVTTPPTFTPPSRTPSRSSRTLSRASRWPFCPCHSPATSTALRFFGGVPMTFADVHPNCESLTILWSDGERWRPLSSYLKEPLYELCEEIAARVEGLGPRLDRLDASKSLDRLRGRLLVFRKFVRACLGGASRSAWRVRAGGASSTDGLLSAPEGQVADLALRRGRGASSRQSGDVVVSSCQTRA